MFITLLTNPNSHPCPYKNNQRQKNIHNTDHNAPPRINPIKRNCFQPSSPSSNSIHSPVSKTASTVTPLITHINDFPQMSPTPPHSSSTLYYILDGARVSITIFATNSIKVVHTIIDCVKINLHNLIHVCVV